MTLPSIAKESVTISTPERLLWRAVLYQAFLDATEPPGRRSSRITSIRTEAEQWFLCTLCTMADSFKAVCDLAGVDYAFVKTFMRRVLAGEIQVNRQNLTIILTESSDV